MEIFFHMLLKKLASLEWVQEEMPNPSKNVSKKYRDKIYLFSSLSNRGRWWAQIIRFSEWHWRHLRSKSRQTRVCVETFDTSTKDAHIAVFCIVYPTPIIKSWTLSTLSLKLRILHTCQNVFVLNGPQMNRCTT